MNTQLETIGIDLTLGYGRFLQRRYRRRRRTRLAALATVAAAFLFVGAAFASGLDGDLGLNPTKWSILGGGDVDHGKATYVHAQSREDGSNSTFMVEHDAGLPPYQAFLLHERVLDAANASSPVPVAAEPGPLCTPAQLTGAEAVALATLHDAFPAGTRPDASRQTIDDAVAAAFADAPCKGLEYAGERARFVYAGIEPESMLMPGVK
jgi:hypothetical protein